MEDGRIPKDNLYRELAQGKHPIGRPYLRFRDVVKRDLVGMNISVDSLEQLADDRTKWRATVHEHIMASQARQHKVAAKTHRMRSEYSAALQEGTTVTTTYQCDLRGRQCLSRIGLLSHKRRCSSNTPAQRFLFF